MTTSSRFSTRSWRCYQAQILGLSVKRLGAVGHKLKDSRSDMSEVRHKYMDSRGEMIVPSGLKTATSVTMKMTQNIVAVQDIAAVCRSHC